MKEENKDTKSFVELSNAREPGQIKVMEEIAAGGYCPFCPEHFQKNHKKPIIKETEHWILTENQWSYDHTNLHLMVVLKYHEEKFENLSPEAAHEYMDLMQWAAKEYKMEGGMFGMRTGKSELSSSTVTHLHGQLVVPNIETIGPNECVAFYIGKPKNQQNIEVVNGYYPVEHRIVDNQYRNLLKKIMREGKETDVVHGQPAKELCGVTLRYDMRNGFPLMNERDLSKSFRAGLREHEAFMNGARTMEDLRKYKVPDVFWEKWTTAEKCAQFGLEPGDIGGGSYGEAFANFPTDDGRKFNQFLSLERQMKEYPMLRTILVTPFIPYRITVGDKEFPRKVTVAPCHGLIFIKTNTRENSFQLTHVQRSADAPVGLVFNLEQYAALGMKLERTTGMRFTELVQFMHNVHIYQCQYDSVSELLKQPPRKLPTMTITNTTAKSIYDFTASDFVLSDYDCGPKMDIPTPV